MNMLPSRRRSVTPLAALAATGAVAFAALAADNAAAAGACSAQSGARVPEVVELYTSEGCSSCPPADRWLGTLKSRDDVVALAFHVDYWDGLGWKDRFAQPAFTQRQNASRRFSGARFAYTPEVLVDGHDTPEWSSFMPTAGRAPAPVVLQLERDGAGLRLVVTRGAGAPSTLGGFVAVVDDGNVTRVAAGENRGATLRQDGVVREFLPWTAGAGATSSLAFTSTSTPEPGATRRWVAVATDAASGKTLQAVTLSCRN